MNKKIIIISGHLASGKSTFALRLSEEINVPYFIKDTFKISICKDIVINNREESSAFSAATFNAITYVAERFMERGFPLIIEGNFVPGSFKKANEAEILQSMIHKYNYQSLTYMFTGDCKILCDRFNEREKLPERGQANRAFGENNYDEFAKILKPLGEFTVGGEIVRIDTTDFAAVDFSSHIETAHKFISR